MAAPIPSPSTEPVSEAVSNGLSGSAVMSGIAIAISLFSLWFVWQRDKRDKERRKEEKRPQFRPSFRSEDLEELYKFNSGPVFDIGRPHGLEGRTGLLALELVSPQPLDSLSVELLHDVGRICLLDGGRLIEGGLVTGAEWKEPLTTGRRASWVAVMRTRETEQAALLVTCWRGKDVWPVSVTVDFRPLPPPLDLSQLGL